MNINWHGQGLFSITAQKSKGETTNIVINPFEKEVGIKEPKLKADVLILGNGSYKKDKISGDPFIISSDGEYDVSGIFVQGFSSNSSNSINLIEAEEITICHMGKFGQKELSAEQLEQIGDVDILMIPVGGDPVMDPKEAAKAVAQIEPKIVIPMYFNISGLKEKLEGVEKFLKTLGAGKDKIEELNKLNIKKKDILSENNLRIIILNP